MKYSKVAVAVAGSVAALAASASASAFAAGPAPQMSLNGGVTEAANALAPVLENPVQHVGDDLATQNGQVGKVLGTVQDVNQARNAVGPGQVAEKANVVGEVVPMLGGLNVNGGSKG
ncbi:hypothetical protein [Streptomyces sp. NPDC089799]|uniref:hypothetical protein n=1 Tax=Streptomyces sp. NPDC089799 TaxID=3155066 RepID=UPI003438F6EA